MLLKKIIVSTFLLVLFNNFSMNAQIENVDSIKTTNDIEDTTKFVMTKSPWGAVLRSAVIPGWGQIYNESYIKAPIILGVTGYFVYGWITSNNDYKDNKNLYLAEPGGARAANYLRLRTFYRDQRDMFTIYLGITYLLNLVDAYVDAHLFDFTIKENFFTRSPEIGIKFNF